MKKQNRDSISYNAYKMQVFKGFAEYRNDKLST